MKALITALLLIAGSVCMAQNASDFFTSAGNQFIDGNTETALNTVNRGLERFPNDARLQKLLEELQKQQEQEQQKQEQQKQEEQQKQDQEKKDQEQKDQQNQEQKDQEKQEQEKQEKDQEQKQEKDEGKDSEEQKDEEKKDSEPTEEEKEQKEKDDLQKFLDKLKEMKISPEKAQMILEAMRNNEIQYVQQNKRKATKRKDRSKPDW
jgi:outer membrane biosynthesis protein TonB